MAKILILLGFCALLLPGCIRNTSGDRLFEVQYPVVEFGVPAGQQRFAAFVAATPQLATRFEEERNRAGVTADDIDLVGGLRARLISTTGEDFGEYDRIELRICPVNQDLGCNQILDIMFSLDDNFMRRQSVINLNPGLRNFRELFLEDEVRMEVLFIAGDISTVGLNVRLEWGVVAFGNVD